MFSAIVPKILGRRPSNEMLRINLSMHGISVCLMTSYLALMGGMKFVLSL